MYDDYINEISELINFRTDDLFKMAFKIYDFNGNDQICELDVVSCIKTFNGTDLEKVYMNDLGLIINKLKAKTKLKGCENRDLDITLAKIYKRCGVLEEFKVGDDKNPHQPPIQLDSTVTSLGGKSANKDSEHDEDDFQSRTRHLRGHTQDWDAKSRRSF